jgi:polygalacturonase
MLAATASALAMQLAPVNAAESQTVTPKLPTIPERTFTVTDYAAVGDGTTMNTQAFRAAIDACVQAGGGRIAVPEGDFLTGPIELKSAMDLHFAKGARLKMSQGVKDYAVMGRERQALITATDAHDVQITGEGTIDGQGEAWWNAFRKTKGTPLEKSQPRRPQMIAFTRCERVRIEQIKTLNPPNTHCSLRQCEEVTIEGVTMVAPDESPNTDALNLNVRNAVIRDCKIATGDDNIVFLASTSPVENVLVSGCTLGVGHGLSFGSYTSGGIRNIRVEGVSFDGTSAGIRMKSARDRGGVVENLTFKNVTMRNVKFPIFLSSYYPKEPKRPDDDKGEAFGARTPTWRNITIENGIITDCPNSIIVWGLPEQPFTDVTFRNLTITAGRGGLIYNAKNVRFEGVEMHASKGAPLTTSNGEVDGMAATPLAAPGIEQ